MNVVGNIHLVAGGREVVPQLLAFLKTEGVEVVGNPDLYVRTYQRFGIEDARELRERASLRGIGTRRIFVITTAGITNEAQNALLKTLEEPPSDAVFFFVVPSPLMLLPTLRSRTQMLLMPRTEENVEVVDVKVFLAATAQQRLDLLKPLLEKDEDDKRDIGAVVGFLSALERGLAKTNRDFRGLEAVYRARKYMGDKGALVKPLLEQVALLVPRVV